MIENLKKQLSRNYQHPFYRKKLEEAGIKPEEIKKFEDFQKIPFMTRYELESLFSEDLYGGFSAEKIVRINFSPSKKGLIPVLQSKKDVEVINEANARAFARAGVKRDDKALITFGYHIFIAGLNFHGGIEALGAKAIPLGPGSTERALEIAEIIKPTVLISNPSFALKLAGEGLGGVKTLIAAGEPFSSIEGYREKVKDAFDGISTIDYYGLAECVPIAVECTHENGLHIVEDFCYVEIIDPETGEVVEEGEKGEVVVTHLNKDAMPMQRFRTGDLSVMEIFECDCGMRATLPKGVFGRTDEMYKVKGVKFYPSQLPLILKSFGLSGNFRVVVRRTEKGTDYLEIEVEGKGVDVRELANAIRNTLLISPNEIKFVDEIGKQEVVDERF
jgi:phenylacetate-CoA ligase